MVITVLISTYNGERYLREQIISILKQNKKENWTIRILVRDDGSSDKTIDILKEFEKKNLLTWYSGSNLKVARSFWNLLFECPESDYYAFCDQDDYWFPNKILSAVDRLSMVNNCPALYASAVTPTDKNLCPLSNNQPSKFHYTDFYHGLIYSTAPGCTFVFNHLARVELNKYIMTNKNDYMHDWLAHKIITINGTMVYDSNPSMYYRQHGNNVVGYQFGLKSFFKRMKKIVFDSPRVRSSCAYELLKFYHDDMDADKRFFLEALAFYIKEKSYYSFLKRTPKIKTYTNKDLAFKILLWLKKI